MTSNLLETNRVDTLIITVGTRQIGWRCKDGIVRSFGADGNGSYPPHVDELYLELGIPRGKHQENDKLYPWSAYDLGQRYYDHCIHWLDNDFSQIELLLDYKIIESAVRQGLKHIILWGTNQPNSVSWFYRKLDTLWLAKLMEGKIKSIWPEVRVDTHTPEIVANDKEAIREELELLILREALTSFSPTADTQFVLWIQNKGCAPAIASGVEICAAALVRQYQVFNACPKEPDPFFELHLNGFLSACHSPSFQVLPMGDLFWPLERMRVISAWERGDLSEAQLWLKLHLHRHKVLHNLAGILALCNNWETSKFLMLIGNWLNSNDVYRLVGDVQVEAWKQQLHQIQQSDFAKAWESCFLIDLPLERKNYTAAFIQFAQTLEKLLYLQSKNGNWISRGFINLPPHLSHLGNQYQPGLGGLINGWCKFNNLNETNKWYKLMNRIREKRNQVIHSADPVSLNQIRAIWSDGGFFTVTYSEDPAVIRKLMMDVLKQVCVSSWSIPNKLLSRSLYEWGLNILRSESTAFSV